MKNLRKRNILAVASLVFLATWTLAAYGSVTGERPLLVILVEYSDRSFDDRNILQNSQARIFGPGEPNVTAYYRETSHGRFTYVPATNGETDGTADGMIRVLMTAAQRDALDPEHYGEQYRGLALRLANPDFNYRLYDTDGDGRVENHELAVLVIQATDHGEAGRAAAADDTACDGVSLRGLPVAVMSDYAPNYVLYHELAHLVDFGGFTGKDLYNLRDGLRQKATIWQVAANGEITAAGGVSGEIALELDAASFTAAGAVTAYRDQNGELSLASYDLSQPNRPLLKSVSRAGLASELSVAQVSPLRVVTAVRSGSGSLKLIIWDVNLNWEFTRRGDYTAGTASDIGVIAVSSTRVVAACRTLEGFLKLIAFDVSRAGELTRRGSYTAGEATEINIVTINSSRVVTAVRTAGGHLKAICFDISEAGEFTRRGDWEAGDATDIDLARISLRRVAASVRSPNSGNLKAILFDVNAQGDVARLGSWEGGPVCDRNIQCTDKSDPIPSDFTSHTSIIGLAQLRMAVSWINPEKLMQVRTLDIRDDGMTLSEAGSRTTESTYISARLVAGSSSGFSTIGQIDGQVWTGNSFGMLGGNTEDDVVHFDPYTKLKLGWLPYTEINSSTLFGLAPMGHRAAQALILRVPGHRLTEYFILEVRTRDSIYESGLNDEGLAIWHVDEEKVYPHPFVSLEWLGGSSGKALWSVDDTDLVLYDDSSSPAGSRWSDFSTSGIAISQIDNFFVGLSFNVRF